MEYYDNLPIVRQRQRTSAAEYLSQEEYIVYKRRWFIISVVALLNISNGAIWIAFSPIANITAQFYDVHAMEVNWLSLVFLIVCIPCGILAIWMIDGLGIRTSITVGSLLNCVGAALRLVSTADVLPHQYRYPLVIAGQTLAACAQPMVLFCPTKVAALWFGEKQRALANTIGSMGNPLGIMLSSVLSPVIVHHVKDLWFLMLCHTVLAGVVTVMALLGICSSVPPTPPTPSAADASEPFLKGIKRLFRMRSYWILCICFGAGLGAVTALSTFIEQILCPRNYINNFSRMCSALMIAFGILGALVFGLIADRTKKFEEVAKIAWAFAALAFIAFTEVSRVRGKSVLVVVSISVFGLFAFGLYPICLELGVECTYPVAEATSAGLLIISGQIIGIILIMVMQVVAQDLSISEKALPNACQQNPGNHTTNMIPKDYTVPNLLASGVIVAATCLFLLFFKADYRRMKTEQKMQAEKILNFQSSQSIDGSSGSVQ